MTTQSILIVEDDPSVRTVLSVALSGRGYDVTEAANGSEAHAALARSRPDAALVDLGLPDVDGCDVITAASERYGVPVIVVSARSDEQQIVRALDAGAKDYIIKPFREGELLARVRAQLRPAALSLTPRVISCGDIRLDLVDRSAFVQERPLVLTPIEFKLLHALCRAPGQVVRHEQLLLEIWGPTFVKDVHYLRVFIKQLRAKIEEDPSRPKRILTALGIGYRVAVDGC